MKDVLESLLDSKLKEQRAQIKDDIVGELRKDIQSAQPAKIRIAGETFANGPIVITFVPSFESELLSLPPPLPPKTSTERKN